MKASLLYLMTLYLQQVCGLHCFDCISSASPSHCKKVKNCSSVFTMCKTTVFLPNSGNPFDGPESVVQDCAVACKKTIEFTTHYTVFCCSSDLCNKRTANSGTAATRMENRYIDLAVSAGFISALLQGRL
ncbi:ly6/PLAUR domain-containing protein 2-like [Ambystoma mexicanum]|uniref:ly6/PLAUR domain-containing protein 2-like n=1 Tax=Ambystoma mexicanum TaxID=8296 RepID=UPI0037E95A8A